MCNASARFGSAAGALACVTIALVAQIPAAKLGTRERAFQEPRNANERPRVTPAPLDVRLRALADMQRQRAALIDAGPTWQSIGPAPLRQGGLPNTGRIHAVAVDPSNANTIYIGAAGGGVWKTTDGGATWRALTDFQCSLTIGSIAIDPVNTQIVYAGNTACGLLRSADGGETWTLFRTPEMNAPGTQINRIGIDRRTAGGTRGTTLFLAAYRDGLLRSTDSGQTTQRLSASNDRVWDVTLDPQSPSTVFALVETVGSAHSDVRVGKSVDGGNHWTVSTIATPGRISYLEMTIARSDPRIGYVMLSADTAFRFFRTDDGGDHWRVLDAIPSSSLYGGGTFTIDPADPNTLVFGSDTLSKSTDGGQSWIRMNAPVHVDPRQLVYDNAGRLFDACDGGLFRSNDRGTTWVSLNGNLAITQFYREIAFDPARPDSLYGGTWDNGVGLFAGDLAWQNLNVCDAFSPIVDPSRPRSVIYTCQWPVGIYRWDVGPPDGSQTNQRRTNGINLSDPGYFVPPLAASGDNRVLYFATNRMYRSDDSAETWQPVGPILDSTYYVWALAVSRTNANHVIASPVSDKQVSVSKDGGRTWTRSAGLISSAAFVRFDPIDDNIAYAIQADVSRPYLYASVNGGASWFSITGNLPALHIASVVADVRSGRRILYVATEIGVYRSTDSGATWTPFSEGLPHTTVVDLAVSPDQRTLVAATDGRGMFALRLGDPKCVDPPATPTGLTSAVSGANVTLSWTAPAGVCSLTGYVVEAGSAAGLSNLAVLPTGGTATTFSATGVGKGTYFVRMRASNENGTSGPSNETIVRVQ
jgi:photosystem II stability/assembly factor-like uncharacterized protein